MRKKMQSGSFKSNELINESSKIVNPLGIKSAISIQHVSSSRFNISYNNEPRRSENIGASYSKKVKEGTLLSIIKNIGSDKEKSRVNS